MANEKASVRFLLVSDIHNTARDGFDATECDAAIIAGDFKFKGGGSCDPAWRHELINDPFFTWCKAHPDLPVFLVPGNHDEVVWYHNDWLTWPKNIVRLDTGDGAVENRVSCEEDGAFIFKGLRLWGSPWCLERPGHNGAVYSANEDFLARELTKMPNGLDIFVIHGPPRLEKAEGGSDQREERHCGSYAIRAAIVNKKPRLVVCGHLHHASREVACIGETRVLNVARVNGSHYSTTAFSPAYVTFNSDGTLEVSPARRVSGQWPVVSGRCF